jgi:hypothetical protein
MNRQLYIRLAARGQAPQRGDAPTPRNRILEPPSHRDDVVEEPDGVEEIRLACGVRPDQEGSLLQVELHPTEVPPVAKLESSEA